MSYKLYGMFVELSANFWRVLEYGWLLELLLFIHNYIYVSPCFKTLHLARMEKHTGSLQQRHGLRAECFH